MDNIKWQKYLRIGEEDFSASCEVDEGARNLHRDLISLFEPGSKVLDTGCGTGWSTEKLAVEKFQQAVGISIQKEEIEFALKNHIIEGTEFIVADMHELPFSDKSFDAVYMRECLEHSISPFIALCEANRVLNMGGQLLVNVPSQEWVDWHCHYIVPTDLQLRSLFFKTGFKVIKFGVTDGGHNYYLTHKTGDII